MKRAILLLLFILTPSVLGQQPDEIFMAQGLTANITLTSTIDINPKSNGYELDYMRADLFFYPRTSGSQTALQLQTKPDAEKHDDFYRYYWPSPSPTQVSYQLTSTVQTSFNPPRVRTKMQFPLQEVPEEAEKYLQATEIINANDAAIVRQANEIAAGEDDLFIVVSKLASWTKNNIKYNLSTLTADVAQPATWVLEQKQGVCDELTSLFIAMLRALGIPARFVSGVSYTNSPLFAERWGAHGWAEVYFPTVGWVPFDPTFGEFGWVDAGHIKLKDSLDPSEPSTKFEWRGRDVDIIVHELDIKTQLASVEQPARHEVRVAVRPSRDEVGIGSYNLVEASVENMMDYYITVELALARVNELKMIDALERQIILRPHEKKTEFWKIKVDEDLSPKYVYTVPLVVYTVRNESDSASFEVAKNNPVYTLANMYEEQQATRAEEPVTAAKATKEASLSCSTPKSWMYEYEKINVSCALVNKGNTPLSDVSICLREQCQNVNLGISQKQTVDFELTFTSPGKQTILVKVNRPISLSTSFIVEMRDKPNISITNIEAPATVKFDNAFKISWNVVQESISIPTRVRLNLAKHDNALSWELEPYENQQFSIDLVGKNLRAGENKIIITVSWKDENDKSYETQEEITITLEATWWQRVVLWFRNLFS